MDLSLISKSDNTPQPKHHPFPLHYHAPPLYKECLRNHAAALGRHSLDGCGEFTPLLTCTVSDTPLTCAACGCHRNFHRREDPSPLTCAANSKVHHDHQLINFSVATPPRERKRFRSRFSKEQKDEMLAFAERLGWKIRRSDDVAIEGFCNKVGVSRGVLKVWMHNNKNTFATSTKKEAIDSVKNGSNLSVGSGDGVNANGDGSLSSA